MDLISNQTSPDSDLLEEDLYRTNVTEGERDGFQEFAGYFQFIVEGIAILIVGVVGVGINLVALGILFRKRVRHYQQHFIKNLCSVFYHRFWPKNEPMAARPKEKLPSTSFKPKGFF